MTAQYSATETLVDRLRGIYRLPVNDGAGPLNGSDEFVRKFDGLPPIHGEAANEIERLRISNAALVAALKESIDQLEVMCEVADLMTDEAAESLSKSRETLTLAGAHDHSISLAPIDHPRDV